jgi:hypothetical protein
MSRLRSDHPPLVASGAVSGDGPPAPPGPNRLPTWLQALVGLAVAVVAVSGLAVQAYRGNRTVDVQRSASTIHSAQLDDAFYHCLDVQTHSLVSPAQPVILDESNFGDFITLLKAVGSWIRVADPPSTSVARLSLRDNVDGPGACLGTVVVARYSKGSPGATVRIGSGDSVPGHGPPPAPPL